MKTKLLTLFVCLIACISSSGTATDSVQPYLDAVQEKGVNPATYVVEKLGQHDLILFDDSNHQAQEPFDFYIQLLSDASFLKLRPTLYIELFGIEEQPHIDAFLAAPEKDLSLLFPVFQSTYTPHGFQMKSYFDLMEAVYETNQSLSAEGRLRVISVSSPAFWPAIETMEDYRAFQKTLPGRDYTMYRAILDDLQGQGDGSKGVFLTNTRHAYTSIRKPNGEFFWNTGTFFRQWHPGKSFSIRIHGPQLFIEAVYANTADRDAQGLSSKKYRWGRMEQGLWDSAFKQNNDVPVAFDLNGTPFGAADYVGNHMVEAAPGQHMAEAYDGLIFLVPLDSLRATEKVDYIYTEDFLREIERRLMIYRTQEELDRAMERAGVSDLRALVISQTRPSAEKPLLPAGTLGPIDAWKTGD